MLLWRYFQIKVLNSQQRIHFSNLLAAQIPSCCQIAKFNISESFLLYMWTGHLLAKVPAWSPLTSVHIYHGSKLQIYVGTGDNDVMQSHVSDLLIGPSILQTRLWTVLDLEQANLKTKYSRLCFGWRQSPWRKHNGLHYSR